MIGERLLRARKAAGFSLRALADLVGVSQTTINKYEKEELTPSSGQLLRLSDVLGVNVEYFLRSTNLQLEGVEYRKRSTTPKKLLDKITVDVTDQAERWIELLELYPTPPISRFTLPDGLPAKLTSYEQIENVAEIIRNKWDLGSNPIPDLIDTLESHGVMVIITEIDSETKFDGLAATMHGMPIIVVGKEWPGDRQRFTLAHELGHLILQEKLVNEMDEEKACNHFAGAFLLPKQEVINQLGAHRNAIEARELYMLKHEFGISMFAALFRAKQAGIISEGISKKYFFEFSKRGWRTLEPGRPYPPEHTFRFDSLVYRALAEEYISESKAAELLKLSLIRFRSERKLESTNAVDDQ